MAGFFSKKETQSKTRPDGKSYTCVSCGLYKDATTPRMEPYGNFKKGILTIGSFPNISSDKRGIPWQGKIGSILQRTFEELGVDLFEDCASINAVNCYPGDNNIPSNFQLDCCRVVKVHKIIEEMQPKVIILLGDEALYSFLKLRWSGDLGKINKWRGWCIPDQDYKAWVVPTYHPDFIERHLRDEEIQTLFKDDLKQAFDHVDIPFKRNRKPNVEIIDNLSILTTAMQNCNSVSLDYETTGLKPHAAGHRIVTASIAIDENNSYAFVMPDTPQGRKPLIEILEDPTIGKSAYNMKFEINWTRHRLRTEIANLEFDGMLASHILDNRQGVAGLKFQTYVNLGVVDYSSEISPYLKSVDSKNGNSMNRIMELLKTTNDTEKLLYYNGCDTIYERRVSNIQKKLLNYDYLPF